MQDADNYFDSIGIFQNQMLYTPLDEQIKYNSNNGVPKFYHDYNTPSYYDHVSSIPNGNNMSYKLNGESLLEENSHIYSEESSIPDASLPIDFPFIHPRDTKDFTPFLLNNVPVDWLRSDENEIVLSDFEMENSTQISHIKMFVELQETLFNRLQWYHVVCKFLNEDVCLQINKH